MFKVAGDAAETDKTLHHGYHRFYPLFLARLRQVRNLGIVEIGYGEGGSIRLWHSLFPSAHVYCLDRDVELSGPGFDVLRVDQSDSVALGSAIGRIGHPVHLIVDDGSHLPAHQLLSFSVLFDELLQEGGVYIVEDVETSYWSAGDIYGYSARFGLGNRWSAIEALKKAVDYVNRGFLSREDRSAVEYDMMLTGLSPDSAGKIAMLTFAHNCVIATKAVAEDVIYAERPYSYSSFTARG